MEGEIVSATNNNGLYGRALIHPRQHGFFTAPRLCLSRYASFGPSRRIRHLSPVHQQDRLGVDAATQPALSAQRFLTQSTGSTTPVFLLKNGYPAQALIEQGVNLPSLQIRAQDPNERTAYVEQASFGPQIQISNNTVLNLTYVGNWGRKENRLRNDNQGQIAGFDGTSPLISFPYANLNTEGVSTPVLKGAARTPSWKWRPTTAISISMLWRSIFGASSAIG